MNSRNLVEAIKRNIVDENSKYYLKTLSDFDVNEISDDYWKRLIVFYRSLPEKDRVLLGELIVQISTDTVSNMLGVIDGVVDFSIAVKLINQENGEIFGDDLQDNFLEIMEVDGK